MSPNRPSAVEGWGTEIRVLSRPTTGCCPFHFCPPSPITPNQFKVEEECSVILQWCRILPVYRYFWFKTKASTTHTHKRSVISDSSTMTRSRGPLLFLVAVKCGMASPNPQESIPKSTGSWEGGSSGEGGEKKQHCCSLLSFSATSRRHQ